jgi:hypothetical protein
LSGAEKGETTCYSGSSSPWGPCPKTGQLSPTTWWCIIMTNVGNDKRSWGQEIVLVIAPWVSLTVCFQHFHAIAITTRRHWQWNIDYL